MAESDSISEPLQELSQRVQAKYPDARFILTLLPRGPNLAIVVSDHLYYVDDCGAVGFGITHVMEEKSFTLGCDILIATLPEAEQYLLAHIETQSHVTGARQSAP